MRHLRTVSWLFAHCAIVTVIVAAAAAEPPAPQLKRAPAADAVGAAAAPDAVLAEGAKAGVAINKALQAQAGLLIRTER